MKDAEDLEIVKEEPRGAGVKEDPRELGVNEEPREEGAPKRAPQKSDAAAPAESFLKDDGSGSLEPGSSLKKGDFPSSGAVSAYLAEIRSRKRFSSVLRSTIFILVVVAAISVLVATLFLPVLQIYGTSMTPTVSEGDIVVCLKGTQFEVGDLCAFWYQSNILVKRVIATENQWVDIDEEGNIYVDGEMIDEPYLEEGAKAYGTVTAVFPLQVQEGRIFVLGDHRITSVDSRTVEVGCIAEEDIVGRIVFRLWPLNDVGWLK